MVDRNVELRFIPVPLGIIDPVVSARVGLVLQSKSAVGEVLEMKREFHQGFDADGTAKFSEVEGKTLEGS